MEYKGFYADVYFDSDDDLFVGRITGIDDIVAFHGTKIGELVQHFQKAVDEYMDFRNEIKQKSKTRLL